MLTLGSDTTLIPFVLADLSPDCEIHQKSLNKVAILKIFCLEILHKPTFNSRIKNACCQSMNYINIHFQFQPFGIQNLLAQNCFILMKDMEEYSGGNRGFAGQY